MASNILTHSNDYINLEELQDKLGIALEQAEALIIVSLDEEFLVENNSKICYSYLSNLHNLIKKAIAFHVLLVGLREEFNEQQN